MPEHDRALGMDRPITRRDFINGVSVTAAGALLLPRWALAMEAPQEYAPERAPGYYPPALTGMRGDHDGSFEVAHALRDRRAVDLSAVSHTGESYDLVVVGAGMNYGGLYRNTSSHLAAQGRAEDLNVIENLVVNKEQRFPDMASFSPDLDAESDERLLILHGQEFHTSYWGHLSILNLQHLLLPGYAAYPLTAAASPYPHNAAVADMGGMTLLSDFNLRLAILAIIASISVIGLFFAFGLAGLIHLAQAAFGGTRPQRSDPTSDIGSWQLRSEEGRRIGRATSADCPRELSGYRLRRNARTEKRLSQSSSQIS